MKRIALTLAAFAAVSLVASFAFAEGALSYPMAAHVAAKYGVQHSGLPKQVKIQQVRHVRPGHHGYHGYRNPHSYRGHYGHQYYHRAPVVVQPYYVPHTRYYRYPTPYYVPRPGITYYGPGVSVGIGF